jgi:hypothetical protein
MFSALADKLAKLKKHAATYASLIIEELDPVGHSSIEVTQNENFISSYHTVI